MVGMVDQYGRPNEGEEYPSSFLVCRSPTTEVGRDTCIDTLTLVDPCKMNLLLQVQERTLDQCLESFRRRVGDEPAEVGVVAVGSSGHSAAETAGNQTDKYSITNVTDPANLTRVGVSINEHLMEWKGNDNRTVVCGGSITAMLQWTELPVLFKFLHVLLDRLERAGAISHFHLNPDAVSSVTVNKLSVLFDETLHEPLSRSNVRTPDRTGTGGDEVMHDILRELKRREILRVLLDEGEIMTVGELADKLVTLDDDATESGFQKQDIDDARAELHHKHLAKLDEEEIVEYDAGLELVQLVADPERVRSHMWAND